MVDIRKLLAYNVVERHAFFEAFVKLSWNEFVEDRGASFGSIRNIFIHSINGPNHWLDFLQGKPEREYKEFGKYKTLEEIGAYLKRVENRMNKYLNSISAKDLKKKYEHGEGDDKETLTVEDVLVHVFEEEIHHRGELIALLWQMGIEPPVIGYPP
ncbi:MAG TPA: DinB family protein [Acidobacteriota bacterium]|nr:DinB family protein [Acidobacteriota bacterium]